VPKYDLEALWEEHCRYEFETRDVDATMATMVGAPYVNHIPTMTGGVGHDQLKRFYKYHFIGANPPDTKLVPVSRTVGTDSLVDEMLFSFTHTSEIDWMLPGVSPTGRKVEVPVVAVVQFHDGKLAHEHIYWDQALPFLCRSACWTPDNLPVAGVAEAQKMVDKTLPSNALMPNWAKSDGKPI
jgi:carboxymethylenebutenolidase